MHRWRRLEVWRRLARCKHVYAYAHILGSTGAATLEHPIDGPYPCCVVILVPGASRPVLTAMLFANRPSPHAPTYGHPFPLPIPLSLTYSSRPKATSASARPGALSSSSLTWARWARRRCPPPLRPNRRRAAAAALRAHAGGNRRRRMARGRPSPAAPGGGVRPRGGAGAGGGGDSQGSRSLLAVCLV